MSELADLLGNMGDFGSQPIGMPSDAQTHADLSAAVQNAPGVHRSIFAQLGDPHSSLRHALGSFLGNMGDAIVQAHGGQPLYAMRQQRQRLGTAVANFLGPNSGFDAIAKENPELAINLWSAMRKQNGEPFTLGKDQARYDANGHLVAQGPAGAPDLTVIDGIAYDSRTGEPMFESPYPKVYEGPQGAIRTQPRIGLGHRPTQMASPTQPSPTAPQGQVVTPQGFANAMTGLPPETAAGLAQRAGMTVRITTPEEVAALPSGVTFIAPDGIARVKH